MKKIVITANTSWYIFNFRLSTILALINAGFRVVVLTADNLYEKQIVGVGAEFETMFMDQKSKNLVKEIASVLSYWKAIKRIKPDVILSFTPKSNIYASLVSRLTGTKIISNVSGLGGEFDKKSIISQLVLKLYKISFASNAHVFFQNQDDRKLLVDAGCVKPELSSRIFGSGVNLTRFYPEDKSGPQIKFIFVARLLKLKGTLHYLNAAKSLMAQYPNSTFSILGVYDPAEKDVTPELIKKYADDGSINFLGKSDNVESVIREYDAIVLPSWYREGVPKALLEGAASGLAIITTDSVGCRDVVIDGYNGFICQPNSLSSLISALDKYLNLSREERETLGTNSRKFAEKYCDEKNILDEYLSCIKRII
ncbi:glycosyltransferase family 4 protein [Erwiniaceae bacterium CAU 1747]